MFYLLNFLLLLPTINSTYSATAHFIYPKQTQSSSTSDPSFTTTSSTSMTSNIMQIHNGSSTTSSATDVFYFTSNVNSSVMALPTPFVGNDSHGYGPYTKNYLKNYDNIKSGFCDLTDNFCSFKDKNGTIVKANPRSMDDQCVLWDASCSGNKTLAMEKFFGNAFPDSNDTYVDSSITGNGCFAQARWIPQADCVTYNPPDRLLEWQKMKDWMRSSQCVSVAEEWQNMTGHELGFIFEQGVNQSYSDWPSSRGIYGSSIPSPSCCPRCNVYAENVAIYYLPEPGADHSCLTTIGGSVRPLDYGATMNLSMSKDFGVWSTFTETYWACNTTDPKFPGTTYDLRTASVTTIGHLAAKVPLYNPWGPSPCIEDNTGSQGSNHSLKIRDGHTSIHARDHSPIIPSSITQNNGLPVSTIVSKGFTL